MTSPNPAQQLAITTTEGPLLIIAGPGSGKTFTLVERALYLIPFTNNFYHLRAVRIKLKLVKEAISF